MILPILLYGNEKLRQMCSVIKPNEKDISFLIEDMFETMYNANGVGLAAPQIGKNISLFILDSEELVEKKSEALKLVCINPKITFFSEEVVDYEEGCLSIPSIRQSVSRSVHIKLMYLDEHFKPHHQIFTDINARIIQHEYDHLQGQLFIDYLPPTKKILIKSKLSKLAKKEWKYPTTNQ